MTTSDMTAQMDEKPIVVHERDGIKLELLQDGFPDDFAIIVTDTATGEKIGLFDWAPSPGKLTAFKRSTKFAFHIVNRELATWTELTKCATPSTVNIQAVIRATNAK